MAIIGAGFGGIAAAVKLQRHTDAEITIFEKSAGVGGTWFDNRYPGCEVDVHSHAYSFSFLRYDWPRTHATQPELLSYAEHVVDHFGLRPYIRLETAVAELAWEPASDRWRLRTDHGEDFEFDVVISALGLLSVPRYPDWPGLEEFEGISFHTSRWEHQHDLTGKRIAVVGTGSTAAQVVPALAPIAGHLSVYQREPGWIEPKFERSFTRRERLMYRYLPGAQKAHRAWLFYQSMRRFHGFDVGSTTQAKMRHMCEDFIAREVADPQVRQALTPSYPWGCKRPIIASTYYRAFNRDNVELVPHAVSTVTPTGLVDATGSERDVDVLILSTGFQPTKFLASLQVKGLDGRSLHDAWQDRAAAFLGVTVAGFPNFFILYGPNTNGGLSIIAQLERQAELAVTAIRRLERGARYIDTEPGAQGRYVRWIDDQIRKHASAMESGCNNYYHSETGHNITQWPGTHLRYAAVTKLWARRGLRANADTSR